MSLRIFGTDEQARFACDGYVRLGCLISAKQLQALCDRIDDIMMGRVRYADAVRYFYRRLW